MEVLGHGLGAWVVDSKHEELIFKFTSKTVNWVKTDATNSY